MTDEQRAKIKELRAEGLGYIKVAQAVGVSVNTVKTYCRRHGLNGEPAKAEARCLFCGKLLAQTPGKRAKKFCDSTCRTRWWSRHRNEHGDTEGMHHFRCAFCGKEFTAYGDSKRKYCSHGCYISDRFNERRGLEAGEGVYGDDENIQRMA